MSLFSVKGLSFYSMKSWTSRRSVQLQWVEKQKPAAHAAAELMQSAVQDCSIPEQGKPGRSQGVSKNLWLTLVKSSSVWEANSANMLQSTEGEQARKQQHPDARSAGSKGIYTFCPRCTGIRTSFLLRIRLIMRDSLDIYELNPSLSLSSCLCNSR